MRPPPPRGLRLLWLASKLCRPSGFTHNWCSCVPISCAPELNQALLWTLRASRRLPWPNAHLSSLRGSVNDGVRWAWLERSRLRVPALMRQAEMALELGWTVELLGRLVIPSRLFPCQAVLPDLVLRRSA